MPLKQRFQEPLPRFTAVTRPLHTWIGNYLVTSCSGESHLRLADGVLPYNANAMEHFYKCLYT